MPQWILASRSPQRAALLAGLGVEFAVEPSGVDEVTFVEADPMERALKLAVAKAKDVHERMPGTVVIGCDTLVVAPDGTLLEKPSDAEDARRMLRMQSGGCSTVHSGLAVVGPDGNLAKDVSSSRVRFRNLSADDIDWWIAGGQWADRSGSFQIDGTGQLLIAHIEGDWTSIVGLPIYLLGQLTKEVGYPLQGATKR